MALPASRTAGRHRAAPAPRRALSVLAGSVGGGLLRTGALAATTAGVVAALVAAPSLGAVGPASSGASRPAAVAVAAPAAEAPQRPVAFGVIGFSAKAKPAPKPKPVPRAEPAPQPKAQAAPRVEKQASRSANYSRSLPGTSGMAANAVAVINETRRAFPHLTSIGGYRAGDSGDHGTGHAVDVMCGSSDGDALAAHLQGMAGTLGIKYIIWKQRIWYPGGGWKAMDDRGSATANHYDHVHVSVN